MSFADILEGIGRSEAGKLAAKLPSWAGAQVEVPSSLNFQQCSSEGAALHKASLLPEGARVADLTGGLGADSWAFASAGHEVWYNERDAALMDAVKRNFAALGVSGVVFNNFDISVTDADWKESLAAFRPDVIYLDPARRDSSGKKVFLLEDCSPDVLTLLADLLSLAPHVMIKVSPMADLTMLKRRLSGYLSELQVIGLDAECKEILCLCRRSATSEPIVSLWEDGHYFTSSQQDSASTAQVVPPATSASLRPSHAFGAGPSRLSPTSPPIAPQGAFTQGGGHGRPQFPEALPDSVPTESGLKLLFVPSAALVKSGLGPGMCLMEYEDRLSHFGKFWEVIENLPFSSSVIKDLGRRYPNAEATARGVPMSSAELLKRLGSKPSGSPYHIFACTLSGQRRLLVCARKL